MNGHEFDPTDGYCYRCGWSKRKAEDRPDERCPAETEGDRPHIVKEDRE